MKKLHTIKLPSEERQILKDLVKSGTIKVQVFRRAQILLKADEGLKDTEIALHTGCNWRSVAEVRKRYSTEGFQRAVYDAKRSGRPATVREDTKAKLIALACTDPPEGYSHWTLSLLVEHSKDKMGRTNVWRVLKANELKPWREKNVVHPKTHSRV